MISEKKKNHSSIKTHSSQHNMLSPKKSLSKLQNCAQRNSVTSSKFRSHAKENQSLSKTLKKNKCSSNSMAGLNRDEPAHKKGSRGRLLSNFQSKQLLQRPSKTLEQKGQKYILNAFKQPKQRTSLTLKQRNSAKSSHNKSYSNQTVIRNTFEQKNNFRFNKSSNADISKIKKKKHDYIKNFNKTSCFQRSISTGFHSSGCELNETLANWNSPFKYNLNSQKPNLNSSKQINQQINKLKLSHQKKLTQINLNTKDLFKKIKSPQRAKLSLITTGYQKILSQLYNVLNQKNSLPECQLSRIDTNSSNCRQASQKLTNQLNSKAPHTFSHCQQLNRMDQIRKSIQPVATQSQSQHWDSYLDCGQEQTQQQQKKLRRAQSQKHTLVKKLNLLQIKKQPIKQYHEQFMDMQQYFSDSWKRELTYERKF